MCLQGTNVYRTVQMASFLKKITKHDKVLIICKLIDLFNAEIKKKNHRPSSVNFYRMNVGPSYFGGGSREYYWCNSPIVRTLKYNNMIYSDLKIISLLNHYN